MSKITELCNKVTKLIESNPATERTLHTELAKIVSNAYTQILGSDAGFCFKFNLPLTAVNKLYATVGISTDEVHGAFTEDWGADAMTNHMYKDPYYQILLLLIQYGVRENKPFISENSMIILMLKIWNGRQTSLIKYCDPKVMRYVVLHMCTKRHLFGKYDDPLALIKEYFMPTILEKYKENIIKGDIQRVLSQAWTRTRQLYISNMKTNIETGKKEAQGGILPLYMKAKHDGLSISSPNVKGMGFGDDAVEPTFDKYATTSNRDDIINSTANFITMSPGYKYPDNFINLMKNESKVKTSTIENLLQSLHNHLFHDIIHDILSVILSKTNINERNDVCATDFMISVKKNIISSKNNADAKKIQQLVDLILDPIFKKIGKDFRVHSNVNQIQLRKIIIYGIVHNLRRNICHTD